MTRALANKRADRRIPAIPRAPLWRRARPGAADRLDHAVAILALCSLAAVTLVGMPAAALFIAAALVLIALQPGESGRVLLRFSPLLLIPLLALASTIWSDAPQRTARAAIQLLLTAVAAILVSRRVGAQTMVLTFFVAFAALAATALVDIPSSLAGRQSLNGMFGSKNALGAALHLVFALGLAVACDRGQPGAARLAALIALPIALAMLWLTQSSTAQLSVAVTLVLFPILMLFGRFPVPVRVSLLLLAAMLLAVALILLPTILNAVADFRENVLQKDATLTGRTYLWNYAAQLSAERPLLGHGYYAFWRHGNLDAEWLWRWGGMTERAGFNFHNAFVEMKVDMGYVGQALLFATCAAFAVAAILRQVATPSATTAFFLTLQTVLYLRSYAETGLIAPFSMLMVLWIAAGLNALAGPAGAGPSPVAPPAARRGYAPARAYSRR